MATIVLFEDAGYVNLLPLVYWRAVFELRLGYDTLLEKARAIWPQAAFGLFVREPLAEVVAERYALPVNATPDGPTLFVNGRLLLTQAFDLPVNTVLESDNTVAAVHLDAERAGRMNPEIFLDPQRLEAELRSLPRRPLCGTGQRLLSWFWDFVHANGDELVRQWQGRVKSGQVLGQVYEGAYLLNRDAIYIGPGTRILPCAVLDAEEGPIYIGANVTVSPNCTIQGPCYIGEKTLIQPGAVIREATTIGPVCKVGGEVEASIIHSYSNKQHDGFLGHSYLGEWINIAADCINSDLKNTYGSVRVPINGREVDSGQMFVGMTVGDHTKSGINCSFPTGAVVGFGSNIFTSAYPPKFVPSFAWLTDASRERYDPQRGLSVARKVMARRKVEMSAAQESLYLKIYELARRHEYIEMPE